MRYFLFVIFLTGTVFAQDQSVRISDFSPGLVTSVGLNHMRLGEALICHNADLNKYPGAITKRAGYDVALTVPGIDSFLWNGIYAANYRDGITKLLVAADSAGVGYGNIYSASDNGITLGIFNTWYLVPDSAVIGDTGSGECCYGKLGAPPCDTQNVYIGVASGTDIWTLSIQSPSGPFSVVTMIDSFVVLINDSCGLVVTATNSGDTAVKIVEDGTDYGVNVYGGDFLPCPGEFIGVVYPQFNSHTTGQLISSNRIITRMPVTGNVRWAQLDNNTYVTNGVAKGFRYDGKRAYTYPICAPGEIMAIPLASAGNQSGTYRYAVSYKEDKSKVDTNLVNLFGYTSTPVVSDGNAILLWNFPKPTMDIFRTKDSITLSLWRTVGDVGVLDKTDSMYYTGISVVIDSTNYSTITITDTLSDDSIRGTGTARIIANGNYYSSWLDTLDTDSFTTYFKPGAPAFSSATTRADSGIWGGGISMEWDIVSGWSWVCLFLDTLSGSPSDTGLSFNIYQPSKPSGWASSVTATGDTLPFARSRTAQMTFVLPRSIDTNVICQIYRGPIFPAGLDTTKNIFKDTVYWQLQHGLDSGSIREFVRELTKLTPFGVDFYSPDYFLIGEYSPGDTIIDSIPFDSLLSRVALRRNSVPPIIKDMAVCDNRLFTTDGEYLYYSDFSPSGITFNALSKMAINPDDGDQITTIFQQAGSIKACKHQSSYKLVPVSLNGYTAYRSFELTANYGCVSSATHVAAPEGDYILSLDGVRLEDVSPYKERSYIGSLMSSQIKSFRNFDITTLRNSFAAYYDGKYMLSFPALDTTFVMQKIVKGGNYAYSWSTWNMTFCGATMFSARAQNQVIPGDTMYFIKSNDNRIYRFGASSYDNGSYIPWLWKSGPTNQINGDLWQIVDFAASIKSTDTVDYSTFLGFTNEKDVTVDAYVFSRLDTTMFNYVIFGPYTDALYFKCFLGSMGQSGPLRAGTGETIINEVMLNLRNTGPYRSQ